MADNTTLSAGTADGAVIAAGLATISGDSALVQMTGNGILSGSEGSWTYSHLAGGAGAVAAGVQRVTLASDDPAVAYLATIDADTSKITACNTGAVVIASGACAVTNAGTFVVQENGAALTALQIIDDWDESDRAKVNPIAGQAGIAAGAGAVGVTVPRVTLASDDPAVAYLATIDADTSKITACNTGAVVVASGTITTITNAVAVTGTFWQGTQPVSVASVPSHAVTNAGTFVVQSTLQTGSAAIGKLAANTGVDIGDVGVLSIAAGANLIGDVGIQGRATGGLSIFYDMDLDETAVVVKAAAGTLYAIHTINTTAAPLYLQLFDVAQGSVTVGTTTPTVQFIVPGNADSDGAGFTFNVPQGIAFGTAITAAASTTNEGNGAPGANACHCNLFYK